MAQSLLCVPSIGFWDCMICDLEVTAKQVVCNSSVIMEEGSTHQGSVGTALTGHLHLLWSESQPSMVVYTCAEAGLWQHLQCMQMDPYLPLHIWSFPCNLRLLLVLAFLQSQCSLLPRYHALVQSCSNVVARNVWSVGMLQVHITKKPTFLCTDVQTARQIVV